MATAEDCFQAKSVRGRWRLGWRGGGGGRGEISAYHVSVSRSRLGIRQGFSIMDKLLIRWERWPTLPSISVCLLLHPPHPLPPLEFASYPTCVLFPLTGQLPRELTKRRSPSSGGLNATFHSNDSIGFIAVYRRPFLFLPSSLLFVFPGSLSAAWKAG